MLNATVGPESRRSCRLPLSSILSIVPSSRFAMCRSRFVAVKCTRTPTLNRARRIENRDLGTIDKIDDSGNLQLRLDSGPTVAFNIKENPHLDYGYAVTSHSSQGQTAARVLIHVDTEQAREKLVNRRLAYVAVSRGRYDAQVYTNDKGQLAEQLARDVSHRSAMEQSPESASSVH